MNIFLTSKEIIISFLVTITLVTYCSGVFTEYILKFDLYYRGFINIEGEIILNFSFMKLKYRVMVYCYLHIHRCVKIRNLYHKHLFIGVKTTCRHFQKNRRFI